MENDQKYFICLNEYGKISIANEIVFLVIKRVINQSKYFQYLKADVEYLSSVNLYQVDIVLKQKTKKLNNKINYLIQKKLANVFQNSFGLNPFIILNIE